MFATVLHGPGDVRFEDVAEPKILKPTDAIIKLAATCICGSDLWPYRDLQRQEGPQPRQSVRPGAAPCRCGGGL